MTEFEVIEKLKFFKETIMSLKRELNDRQIIIEEQRSQIDDLQKSFNSCEIIVEEKVSEIKKLEEELFKNNQTIDNLQKDDNEFKSIIESQKIEIETLNKEIETLKEKNNELTKSNQEKINNEIILKKEIHKKDFQLTELSEHITDLEKSLKEKEDEINSIKDADLKIKEDDLNSLINYNFGKTTESVKNAFIKFIEALYEDVSMDGEEYKLSSWSSATKRSGVSSKAARVFSNRLTSMTYRNDQLIRETPNGILSQFDKDFIIKYCTNIVGET